MSEATGNSRFTVRHSFGACPACRKEIYGTLQYEVTSVDQERNSANVEVTGARVSHSCPHNLRNVA